MLAHRCYQPFLPCQQEHLEIPVPEFALSVESHEFMQPSTDIPFFDDDTQVINIDILSTQRHLIQSHRGSGSRNGVQSPQLAKHLYDGELIS